MRPESVLVVGDIVEFQMLFNEGGALLTLAMTPVTGTAPETATERGLTLEGDQALWIVPAAPYIKLPAFTKPGIVTCKIEKLDKSNIAEKIQLDGKSVLLVGSAPFKAKYIVSAPAMDPKGTPDPTKQYTGYGVFRQMVDSKALNQG